MIELLGAYDALALGAGAALAIAAAVLTAWGRWPRLARMITAVAILCGATALYRLAARTGQRPFSSIPLALAAVGVASGGWSVASAPSTARRAQVIAALLVTVGLVAYALLPATRGVGAGGEGWRLAVAETCYVLAVGALCWGSLANEHSAALRRALLFQSWGLFWQGYGAQFAWGSYWSWDPIECWRLAAWLALALAALTLASARRNARRAQVAWWFSVCFALGALLGSQALVRWLGLASLYNTHL